MYRSGLQSTKTLGQTLGRHPACGAFFFPPPLVEASLKVPGESLFEPAVIDGRCALDRARDWLGQGQDAAIQLFHIYKQGEEMSFTASGDRRCHPCYQEAHLKAHLIIELQQPAV